MEGRETASPNTSHPPPTQHGGHVSFGSYFHPLMASSPSIIAPTAKRHSSVTPPFSLACNPSSSANINYNPTLSSSNSIAHNLNTNAVPNPNSASPVYFGGAEATAAAPAPPPTSGLASSFTERALTEPVKKKRGRPRKYTSDVNGAGVSIMATPASGSVKKKRAPKSGKKAQLAALGAAGHNFTPHVLTVSAGEDVSTKIITFTSQGPWAVCILSANGAISNATLRHAGVSGGAVTYEGRFEILSLSGSFLLTENGGTRSRTGGLSVSLAGPDGRVIGGGVAGLLMAASPVQVVVGTFFMEIANSITTIEANSGLKTLGPAPVRTPTSVSMPQPVQMESVNAMQDPLLDAAEDGEKPHALHPVPLRSIDCFGSHFEADGGADSEPRSIGQ